jgi:hypothetical protein
MVFACIAEKRMKMVKKMAKYRKKPVIIDAEVYKDGMEDGYVCYDIFTKIFIGYFDKNGPIPKTNRIPAIKTLEGFHEISEGDYIITGVEGERYPCKSSIFEKTYELVKDENNDIGLA